MVSLKRYFAENVHEMSSQVNFSASSMPDCAPTSRSLECCNLNAPDPTRLDLNKEFSARVYGHYLYIDDTSYCEAEQSLQGLS